MLNILIYPIAEIAVIGILSGIVGVLALLRSRIFFAESISHATFPGAVVGVVIAAMILSKAGSKDQAVLSFWLFVGAAVMCILLTVIMHWLAKIPELSSQASAGIVLTFGFALGYFLNKWCSPLPLNIESFLTGSLMHVNLADVAAALVVLVFVLAVLLAFGKKLIFYSFDEDGFAASGQSCAFAEMLILTMVVATIVVMIPAVGTILSIALLAAPAACMKSFVGSVGSFFVAAPIVGVLIGLVGLAAAVSFNLSPGGTVAVCAGVFYFAALFLGRKR
ncbi:metal ABC transporter permease [Arcanobacterium sp. S3PF19]|uniref:metal ABC transporter permease n=1 Tax=Arcanobacterium sp. S3PF19 TaxID=1219585 RepID=UPI00050DCA06|nr:metal ABC transporter permease [Arcanobacterium sp. S3PF19]KGF05852.1 zinc ABC transporter permease [Arcanobacterium sp. S3PF19]